MADDRAVDVQSSHARHVYAAGKRESLVGRPQPAAALEFEPRHLHRVLYYFHHNAVLNLSGL